MEHWINTTIGVSVLRDHLYTPHMSSFTAGTSVMYSTVLGLIFLSYPPLCQPLTLASWDHWPSEWGSHIQSFRPYFHEKVPLETLIWFFPVNHVWSGSAGEITKLQSELLMRRLGQQVKPDYPTQALRLNWTVIVYMAFLGTPGNWAITFYHKTHLIGGFVQNIQRNFRTHR